MRIPLAFNNDLSIKALTTRENYTCFISEYLVECVTLFIQGSTSDTMHQLVSVYYK